MSDASIIRAIMEPSPPTLPKFADSQWGYINDQNNGSYTQNIQFSLTQLKQQFIVLWDAYLLVPITLTAACYAYSVTNTATVVMQDLTPFSYICFRDSVLNLIWGLILSTDQGQVIVNEQQYLPFINNFRLRVENPIDWLDQEGQLLHMSMDTWLSGNICQYYTSQINQPQATVPVTGISGSTGSGTIASGEVFTVINGPNVGTRYVGIPNTWAYNTFASGAPVVSSSSGTFTDAPIGDWLHTGNGAFNVNTQCGGIAGSPASQASQYMNQQSATHGPYGTALSGFNAGTLQRCTILQAVSTFIPGSSTYPTGGTQVSGYAAPTTPASQIVLQVAIPIRFIHDVFMQLDFPIINLGLNLTFNISSFYGNAPFLQTSQQTSFLRTTGITTAGTATDMPPVEIYQTPFNIVYGNGQGSSGTNPCRLYYRSVKFAAEDNVAVTEMLKEGYTKNIKFLSTDFVLDRNIAYDVGNSTSTSYWNRSTVESSQVTRQLTSSIVNFTRLVAMMWPGINMPGAWVNNTTTMAINSTAYGQCGYDSPYLPSGCPTGVIRQANLQINSQNYFTNWLLNEYDFWNQLSDQFNQNTGSMIRPQDFFSGSGIGMPGRNLLTQQTFGAPIYRYHVFDATRLKSRLPSPTEPVAVQISYTYDIEPAYYPTAPGTSGAAVSSGVSTTSRVATILWCMERMSSLSITFSSSNVELYVGNIV